MSLQIAKEIHCDGCGEWLRLDFDLVREAWPMMRREGWTREGGKHWCPLCGKHGTYENHPKNDDDIYP